jgi:hypothetical protein
MSRFTDQQAITVNGQNITVNTRPGRDLAAVAALPGLIEQAKSHLAQTDRLLAAGDFTLNMLSFAQRYFLTGKGGPSKSELRQMRFVVSSTRTGLSGDMTLKIGKLVGRPTDEKPDGKDVRGAVRQKLGDAPRKAFHTVGPELKPRVFDIGSPKNWVMGAIRLDDETLAGPGPLGLVTLIHEATHKYAGTIDYRYFKDDGVEPKGTFNSRAKALCNADSYAWFVVAIGKPEVWHTNAMFSNATKSFDNPLYTG